MPARTNTYQRLVLAINRMFVSKTATVTESKMLWDTTTEQEREIDIFIEDSIGPYKVTIGIECTAKKQKLDIKAVEQLIAKHESLGINRTVIVAMIGFTEPAKRYAKKKGAELLTFDVALKTNWPAILKGYEMQPIVSHNVTFSGGQIFVEKEYLETGFDPMATPLIAEVDGKRMPISELAQKHSVGISSLPKALISFRDSGTEQMEEEVEKEISFDPPITVSDANGTLAKIRTIIFNYRVVSTIKMVELSHGTYAGKAVAYGEAGSTKDGKSSKASILLTEGSSGSPTFTFSVTLG